MHSRVARAVLAGIAVAMSGVCGCASNPNGVDAVGAIALNLNLAPGITLASLTFSITHPTALPEARTGMVDLSHSQAIAFVVGGLPATDGYTVALNAVTDGSSPLNCTGVSGFDVQAGATSPVGIALVCGNSEVDGGQNGSVAVVGKGELASSCATVTSWSASPSETNVGSTMQLVGTGVNEAGDDSNVILSWSLNDGAVGTLSSTSGPSTVFTCVAAGTATVTLAASFGDAPACPTPLAEQSVTLTCDSTCAWGLARGTWPSVGVDPSAVAAGDINGDGVPDIAVTNSNLGRLPGTVGVLLGKGDGTFHPQTIFAAGGLGTSSLAIRDLDGDGKLDVAVTNTNSNLLSILRGKGDGTLGAPVSYPTGSFPTSVAAGDLNGDGVPDIVVANFGNDAVGPDVFLGKGDGTFEPAVEYTTDFGGANSLAIGDLNGDGKPDLAVATDSTNAVSVLLGNGDGTFQAFVPYRVGPLPWSVVIGDLNGDGKPDLAVANQSFRVAGSVSVLLGNGDGTFQTQAVYPAELLPSFVAIADLNGDGAPDLSIANNGSNDLGVFLGNGDGTFQPQVAFATGSFPASIAIADLNGDAKPDLAAANQTAPGSVSVLLNDCAP